MASDALASHIVAGQKKLGRLRAFSGKVAAGFPKKMRPTLRPRPQGGPNRAVQEERYEAGLTPKAYAAANRSDRIQKALFKRHTVTEAIYEAGFNSNGRFYADRSKMLGMKPKGV